MLFKKNVSNDIFRWFKCYLKNKELNKFILLKEIAVVLFWIVLVWVGVVKYFQIYYLLNGYNSSFFKVHSSSFLIDSDDNSCFHEPTLPFLMNLKD